MPMSKVVEPRGAISGIKIRSRPTTKAASKEITKEIIPALVRVVMGVLLNENIAFFAQPIFLKKLFV